MVTTPREHVYKPAWFCIYCSDGIIRDATKRKLGAEHIIPFGLGGIQIFPRSSCKKCEGITGPVEQSCLRMMFGPTRIRLGLPTRNPEERPTELILILSQETTPIGELRVPASEFPLVIPGLKLPPPGILVGERPHDRLVGEFTLIQNEAEVRKYLVGDKKGFRVATFNNHVFMQMLAKIAHSYAVAEWGFHSFRALLPDLILGRSQTASHWVGGSGRAPPPDPSGLHRLELKREVLLATTYVVAYIRLFCNFGAPEYRVVVGTWNEGN
jgi:hypothetical protein